ncbi:MAG: hypothetical protein K1X88_05730 [Nannocystaceae bacterium]|nr:hypothetical protein [Nannocystaceae bacterium]
MLAAATPARADESAEPQDGAVLLRSADAPVVSLRPWLTEMRAGRELTWTRWIMAGDGGSALDPFAPQRREQLVLGLAEMRGDVLVHRPGAGATALTAVGSVASAGLPVLGIRRDGKLVQRHSLRMYSRGRGLALAWRIEF